MTIEARRGIELIRRLDPGERALLRDAFAACRPLMPEDTPEIHWTNLYLNGAFTVDHELRVPLHAWVARTVAESYASWAEVHLLAYNFTVNPRGNLDGQPFHVDYGRTTSNLFVPLTHVSMLNATQFIRRPLVRARMDEDCNFGTDLDILAGEGLDAIEITQLVCQPFSLLKLHPDTPHRGTPNLDDHDRVMLCITVDDHPRPIDETTHYRYSSRRYEAVAPR